MKTMKAVTHEEVRDLFDETIFQRGKEYYESGAVQNIELLDENTTTGTVIGNEKYKVSVSIDSDGELSCECSCPCDFNCKHAAALLLKWLEQKDSVKNNETQLPLRPLLKETLNNWSREELIAIISLLIEKKPELRTLIIIDGNKIVSQINNIFSEFISENKVNDTLTELDTIIEGIKRNRHSWNKALLESLWKASKIMINNYDNVHEEGDLGIFLEEWFEVLGEVFAKTNPSLSEKQEFIEKISELIKNDEYSNEGSYEKAFIGLCTSKEDLKLIEKTINQLCNQKDYAELSDYDEFFLKIYEKLGLNEEYLNFARKNDHYEELINKLISLSKLEEALTECINAEKTTKDEYLIDKVIQKKTIIFEKLGKTKELFDCLFLLSKDPNGHSFFLKLKSKCSEKQFKKYFEELIEWAKKNKEYDYLSKIYFSEKSYAKAFEFSKEIEDFDYMERLAKKLEKEHPQLACETYKELIFGWINTGTGYHYEKAGELLKKLKTIDKNGKFFAKTKAGICAKHKLKWSLIKIIEKL